MHIITRINEIHGGAPVELTDVSVPPVFRRSSPSNYNDVKLKLLQESAGSLEFRDTDVLYPSDPNSVSYATGPMQDDVYGAAVGSTQLGSMMDLQHGGQHVQDAQGQDPDGKKKRKYLRL